MEWLGNCTNIDIDVGIEDIKFWIYADELVCLTSLKLEFSTENGQKVTFWGTAPEGKYWPGVTTERNNIRYLKNQSRKFKSFSIEIKDVVYIGYTIRQKPPF